MSSYNHVTHCISDRWERTNGKLPDGSQVLSNGDLKIFRVMKGDEGGYTCFVKNELSGIISSKTATVTVDGKFKKTKIKLPSGIYICSVDNISKDLSRF